MAKRKGSKRKQFKPDRYKIRRGKSGAILPRRKSKHGWWRRGN